MSIASQVIELILRQQWQVGHHLRAQVLADILQVSRSPVNLALVQLAHEGILEHKAQRGYFLKQVPALGTARSLPAAGDIYAQIADDRLNGSLPDTVSESYLRQRYQQTSTQLQSTLAKIQQEGWVSKRPGYGWTFSDLLTTPDSLLQSYRLRLALEPAALLEPGYSLTPEVIAQCRTAEQHLLDGGIHTDSAQALHQRGVQFHEAIVSASGNEFFIDTLRRVNRIRRLLSYRSTLDRSRFALHCEQHLQILRLLEQGKNRLASQALHAHLKSTLKNLEMLTPILLRKNDAARLPKA
jgi:DNA-binding GntR family transcriptional regulator